MRILYYTWFENSQEDMVSTLVSLGHEVVKCNIPFKDYEQDEEFTRNLEKIIKEHSCDSIFSFNFFPLIARTAERFSVKYISWVYDCPHWTLYSPGVKAACNYIFVFDDIQFQKLAFLNLPHLFHFPLAVNTTRMERQLGKLQDRSGKTTAEMSQKGLGYRDEISFVGSLYENNLYDRINYLPEYLKGYMDGIMQAQEKIYGYNFVSELLTEEIVKQLNQYVAMDLGAGYLAGQNELYGAMINAKITSRERIHLLDQLSRKYSLTLYTASDMEKISRAKAGGTVDYQREMPQIFRTSKINLNMTLRSIQSGIPLRALDIMGAGGFLLSNYQPELAEHFTDGQELAMYGSEEELLDKAAYYLIHETEREEIAYRGFLKVQEQFSYEVRVRRMLELVNQ